MKVRSACCACLLASACGHDLTRLEPSLDKAAAWLPDGVPAECVTCVTTACAEQARACLDDRGCHAAFGQCQPANPSCGLGSRLNRDLAVCIQGACVDRCYPVEERLSCLADYSLPQPPSGRSIEFEIELNAYGSSLPGSARAEVCFGLEPQCDAASAVDVAIGGRATLRYAWSAAAQTRPYVRMGGEGLQTTLTFEDVPILPGHLLPLTAIPNDTVALMHALLKLTPDPALGSLTMVAFDCTVTRLAGVRFRLERDGQRVVAGVPYYFQGETPMPDSGALTTQERTFVGGVAALPPGVYDVIAELDGSEVGRARSIVVLAGVLSQALVMPTDREEAAARAR